MTVATQAKTAKSPSQREAALRRREPASWGQVGLWLDEVEQTESWREQARSFTEWLKSTAPGLKVKEGSLWRYLTASRYYSQLRERLHQGGIACPPISSLPGTVSPESIELLAKIERVATAEAFQDLAVRVISETVPRSELRRYWQSYREVLLGKTARGKADIPRYDPTDRRQSEAMFMARTFAVLREEAPRWTACSTSGSFCLHSDVRVRAPRGTQVLDAVAAVQPDADATLCIHVIEIITGKVTKEVIAKRVDDLSPYGERLWLAFPEGGYQATFKLPIHVGVLEIGERFNVIRLATEAPSLGTASGETAKGLLLKTLSP